MITIIVVAVVAVAAIYIITRKGKQPEAPKPAPKPVQKVTKPKAPITKN